MIDLAGDRVVITGAGGGVGRALCAVFARAGAAVVGCDVAGATFPEACAQTHEFDLRDPAGIDNAARDILSDGTPRVVVQNAGWTRAETLADVTHDNFAEEMGLNFAGVARLGRAILPAMRELRGDRAFVFVSSVNAVTHFGNPTYSAAKAAGLAWMRAIAVEEGHAGLRANAVIPASIRTHAWDHRVEVDPDILTRLSRLYPLGRIVTPEEVANAVLFLASPLASGITGTTLNVDAGLAASNLPFLDAISGLGA